MGPQTGDSSLGSLGGGSGAVLLALMVLMGVFSLGMTYAILVQLWCGVAV